MEDLDPNVLLESLSQFDADEGPSDIHKMLLEQVAMDILLCDNIGPLHTPLCLSDKSVFFQT